MLKWASKSKDLNQTAERQHPPNSDRSNRATSGRSGRPGDRSTDHSDGALCCHNAHFCPERRRTMAENSGITRDMLPELLLSEGHATVEQIADALGRQNQNGVFFGEILTRQGILGEDSLVAFLASHCKMPYLDLHDYVIDQAVLTLIPADICWKYHLLPLDRLGRNLTVAMVNPLNQEALSVVRGLVPNLRIRPILCDHRHFEAVAEKFFGKREGHDEYTWAYTPVLSPVPAKEEVAASASADAPDGDQQRSPAAASDMTEDGKADIRSLLDREALIRAIFASESRIPQNHGTGEAPAGTDRKEPSLAEKIVEREPDEQHLANLVVTQFNSSEDLVQQVTGVLFESMHETYTLLSRKMPLFSLLSPGDVARLYSEETITVYEEGATIFKPQEQAEGFYVVLGGQVEMLGEDGLPALLNPGDLFGEEVFAGAAQWSSIALAKTRASVLEVKLSTIKRELSHANAIQLLSNVIAVLNQRSRLYALQPA